MLKKYYKAGLIEAGCDEAGRGCLAGPVVAAAVIWNNKIDGTELNDSKKISKNKRNELRAYIEQNALAWSVAFVDNNTIDEINILNASFLAMHNALNSLQIVPEIILVDGNRFTPYKKIPHACIIKGDAKYISIAAASILAKTHRDAFMEKIHLEFPQYNWIKNKGYPTKDHREGIKKNGACIYHRQSFTLLTSQLQFEF
jgi:ribonuclease HII